MFPRHATDIVSLVFATIFAGFTAVWLLVVTDVIAQEDAPVAGPITLILAGAVGLIAAFRPDREREVVADTYQNPDDEDSIS